MENIENSLLISSCTTAIKKWSYIFKDISDGGDMLKWNKIFHTYLSVLLGSNYKHIGPSPAIRIDEYVCFIAPCFFDQAPIPTKQFDGTDKKIKFNSQFSEGFILIASLDFISIHIRDNINSYEIHRNPISELEIHEMKFKFSKLSMTSAGKGYEIIFPDHKILFRLGLMWADSHYEKNEFLSLFK